MSLLFSLYILSTAKKKALKSLSGLRGYMSLSTFSSVNTYFIHKLGAFIKNTFYSVFFIVSTVTNNHKLSGLQQ